MSPNKKSIPMMSVRIVIEPDGKSFFGWSPDLAGVMVEGDTEDQTKEHLREAIMVHIEGMLKSDLPLPPQILVQDSAQKSESSPVIVGDAVVLRWSFGTR